MRTPIDIPPGLKSDDTNYSSSPAWVDGSNMRFRLGRPQTIGGWESLMSDKLTGVCRAVMAWTDNTAATLNIAFGTHSKLQLWKGGALYDITPYGPAVLLGANPLSVTNGSATVSVSHAAHGFTTGQQINVANADPVGRITVNGGPYAITVVDADHYTFSFTSNAQVAKTLGANPLAVTNGSQYVTVTETGYNIASGTSLTISGATATGGITPNGTFPLLTVNSDADHYQILFSTAATSTATSGGGSSVVVTVPSTGGGSNVVIIPQSALAAGAVDGTGSSGFGTGAWNVGAWNQPSTQDYFPRTWSLSPWGQKLLASPRNGGLYEWSNDTAQKAVAVGSAPTQITQMLVAPQRQVFALGCTQENGLWNPLCIRHSGIGDETQWRTDSSSSSTAREYVLPGGGRIVGGRFVGRYLLVWTTQSLFLGTYVGQIGQVWSFNKVGDKCGLIGPNAAAVLDTMACWVSPDLQFHSYVPGNQVQPIACPIRSDFAENVAASQADKITASTVAGYGEVWWDYPDQRDGTENSRYVAVPVSGPDAGSWFRGKTQGGINPARTARFDAGPAVSPIGVSADGSVTWHERGYSADAQPLPWFIKSSDLYMDENAAVLIRQVWPDIAEQKGAVNLTVQSTLFPQGEYTTYGPFTVGQGQTQVDFKASGRLFQVTYSGASAPTFARIGRLVVDMKPRGRKG